MSTITEVGWVFMVEVGRRQEGQKYDNTRWGGCVSGGGGKTAGGVGAVRAQKFVSYPGEEVGQLPEEQGAEVC